jgi:uncharacterized membrane protein
MKTTLPKRNKNEGIGKKLVKAITKGVTHKLESRTIKRSGLLMTSPVPIVSGS